MIKTITIQNFQSHRETTLELVDGVNVIVGKSDTGKSAIIRALRWLVWNRPTGEEFRSTWGGETDVTVEINDEVISRIKDKVRNSYEIGTPATVFKAFGVDVPEEVTKLLNLNETNLQQQLDRHFLLSDSPGEVAAHFNRVAHLEKIDTALQHIEAWVRQAKQDARSTEERLQQQEGELKRFEHLERFEADVEVLEHMDAELQTKHRSKQQLTTLITNLKQLSEQIEDASAILQDEKPVNTLLDLYTSKNDFKARKTGLERLLYNLTATQKKLVAAKGDVLKLEKTFRDNLPSYCPIYEEDCPLYKKPKK